MAINFPSPSGSYAGQTFTVGNNIYVFDGTAWSLQASANASSTPTFQSATITGALTTGSIVLTGSTPWVTPTSLTSALGSYATTSALTTALAGISTYTLPTAQAANAGNVLGGVIPDGTTITINGSGVISGANTYVLPTATTSVKGGVTIPAVGTSGLTNTSGAITLATASTSQLGGVKIDGTSITINNGVISGYAGYTLPAATTSALGGVIIPIQSNSGLSNSNGTIRLATASTTQLGGVRVDGSTILINGSGVISASIAGAITFQGGWNAATNSPTLSNAGSAYNTNGYEFVVTAAGTVNFGAGNITFAVGDNVIFNGTAWIKVPIGSSSGSTTNAVTFDSTGSGASTGITFNGSAAVEVSYNTIGASPLAGSTSINTLGTITTGVWNGTLVSPQFGGTGVNNGTYTLTLTGGSYTLNQSVASGAAPTFAGTNFTSIPNTALANNSITIGTTATALGGTVSAINGVPIGAASSNTGSFTNLSASGTVSGTGFSSYLASPPAIGGTTAAAGAFTTLSASSTVSGTGFSTYLASPPTIGGTTPGLVWASSLIIGTNGIIFGNQPTPTALTATATLTIAQLLTQIVTVTSTTAVSLTLPTGTLTDAGVLSGTLPTNDAFDWYIINLGSGSGAVTLVAGTAHTYVGSTLVAIATTAHFRTRKTASNTYVTYRLA
jgi:hypothetical protein